MWKTAAVVACLSSSLAMTARAGEPAAAGRELPANAWVHLEKADVSGRGDMAMVYDPEARRFLVLGGQPGDGKDLPYPDGALDLAAGQWENLFPKGKDWGPKFGECSKLPGFKPDQAFGDVEGNPRLSLRAGFKLFWIYRHYAYAPEQKRFIFLAGGYRSPAYTFSYEPAERAWKDLAPAEDPVRAAGGLLHWGSMCWAENLRRIVLFGGANVGTERGDPGTWTYDPAANKWAELKLEVQPPQRANSQLAYDPVAKKLVLFGGDGLNVLRADTWAFDGQKWEELKPPVSPSPRAGHAFFWHPGVKKLVLLGGYAYDSQLGYHNTVRPLPLEMWTYDSGANRWELARCWDGDKAKSAPPNPCPAALTAAVAEDGSIGLLVPQRYRGAQFWLGRFDLSTGDAALTAKHGVAPGAVERRTADFDPAWYKDAPPADPAKTEAELKGLPANQWALRRPPRAPGMNMDWGGAAYLAKLDVIARFSGGHCAQSGSAPWVYCVGTDRWSLPFAPEMPIDFNGADNGVPGAIWTFGGNPWMGSHTWKHTAADAAGQYLVYPRSGYTWFFDPAAEKWRRSKERFPFRHSETQTTMCTTPGGVVAWTVDGQIWLMPPEGETWKRLPVKGALPALSPDCQGMAYDSKRNRLVILTYAGGKSGEAFAYDLASGEAQSLNPAGKESAKVRMRETIYLLEHDMVMVASVVQTGGKWQWLFYDCAKNTWLGAELAGQDPFAGDKKTREFAGFNVSTGLTYDSKRKLVWLVGQHNTHLYTLRPDPKTAGLEPLK